MPDLNIINSFSLTVRGKTISGFQGASDDDTATTEFVVDVDGPGVGGPGVLATATARTIWDDDDDAPNDFDYFFFVGDQDCYIQVICSATSFIVCQLAGVPFTLAPKIDAATAKALGAASTTAMSGSAPSVTEIDSIVIQQNSGNDMNYFSFLAD